VIDAESPTTAGVLALGNLQAQIDGQAREACAGRLDARGRAELVELVLLRAHVLGCIADYERAEVRVEQLTHDAPTDGVVFLTRARVRATFHQFTDGLGDLADALRLGADTAEVDAERAAILQAIGRYDEAFTILRNAVKRRADFASLAALASLYADRGDVATAEHLFHESREHYHGVSPIPVAQLDFRHALMWFAQRDLRRAHRWLVATHHRMPDYAPAHGHLAEVEAALGETDSAIARLRPLTITSDDPDYAAQLARILSEVGRVEEAREWRARAAARYDELLARHPEAFAEHAAEFWLQAGADPHRALSLATLNLEVRRTPRARELLFRARSAVDGTRPGSLIPTDGP
jgi:tetratricopeptide (TPR) repeat protein